MVEEHITNVNTKHIINKLGIPTMLFARKETSPYITKSEMVNSEVAGTIFP